MALKTCNPTLPMNAQLEPSESEILYKNMRDVVWIVKIMPEKKRDIVQYCTGFCVHENGYILTSAFSLYKADTILVRSLRNTNANSYITARRLASTSDNDDGIALLKIDEQCDHARIGDDDTILTPGRSVFGISHPGNFYFTLFKGRLVSALKGKGEVGIGNRVLHNYIQGRSANLQLLHIYGFHSNYSTLRSLQTLGAPVFNSRGHIIGMVVAVDGGFDYAVPATHLQQFFAAAQLVEGSSGQMSYH